MTNSKRSPPVLPQIRVNMDLPTIATIRRTPTEEKIQDHLDAVYTDDFNILEVHEILQKRFAHQIKFRIPEIQRCIALEESQINKCRNLVQKKAIESKISQLRSEESEILSSPEKYKQETSALVDVYRSLGSLPKVISLKSAEKTQIHHDKNYRLRHYVISRYLDHARQYIQLNVTREIPTEDKCPECQCDMSDVIMNEDNGIQTCPHCGYEKYNLMRSAMTFDNSGSPTLSRTSYDDRENFLKGYRRYEGKQPNRLPNDLEEQLDAYFISFGMPKCEEIRKLPLTENGTRGDTTREMMFRALAATGNAAFYEDVNFICHLVWHWSLPDISHLEEQVLEDYELTQRVYESLPRERKSNLNIQYRLFKHLEMRGHSCTIDEFKTIKTRDILEYHDSVWQKMIQGVQQLYPKSGFIFIPTI